jgi:uncharacterized protein (TIGR02099 family)
LPDSTSENTLSPAGSGTAEVIRPLWRRWASRAFTGLLLLYVACACIVLLARHVLLPEVDSYRPQIERAIGDALQRQVRIDHLAAQWNGLYPQLEVRGLTLLDEQGQPALRLEQVDAAPGYSSLLRGRLHLHRLDINGPQLQLRRDTAGVLHVAGLAQEAGGEPGGFLRWLLAQGQINIRNAGLVWLDEQRPGSPPLHLTQVNLRLDNSGSRHLFGLSAQPPRELAQRLDLRGDVRLPDESDFGSASGELFASLEGADMAVWRAWVDYPVELPQGRGAARVWARFDGPALAEVTGELALADVKLRLAPELPLLDLVSLSGRVSAAHLSSERVDAHARQLELVTRDGVSVSPTSIDVKWQAATGGLPGRGEVSANTLDLDALTRLAAFMPLSDRLREQLARRAPRGRLLELDAGWSGDIAAPAGFRVSATFDRVGMNADGDMPGFAGLSGRIDGSDARGSLVLDAPGLTLDLPGVFAEPKVAFAQFALRSGWTRSDGETAITIESVSFRNADAHGQFHGRYQTMAGTAGEIDLEGKLLQGDARAVWRYLPLTIGADTRDWLRSALTAGHAPEATLRLRGKLDDFPFDGGRDGTFQVRVKAEDVTVNFGESWPPLTALNADVLFEGKRMLISSHEGAIMNTRLGATTAEIPDLDAAEEMLLVRGSTSGATADVLRYIDASPIAERIDRFTSGMRAEGRGKLTLALDIPLRHSKDTTVKGEYAFAGNRLTIDDTVPVLHDAAGKVSFTDSALSIRGAQATALGFPMTLDVTTAEGGMVKVDARGRASMEALRSQFPQPWLAGLHGSASWQARLGVLRAGVDMTVEADLSQVSSTLPAPFAKPAGEALDIKVERIGALDASESSRRGLPAIGTGRELLRVSAGRFGSADIVRRSGPSGWEVERGAIGLPKQPALPERGLALAVQADTLDIDALRSAFAGPPASGSADAEEAGDAGDVPVSRFSVDAKHVRVLGHPFDAVKADGRRRNDAWEIDLASTQARGRVSWNAQGKGRVQARFDQLVIDTGTDDAEGAAPAAPAEVSDELEALPALDIAAESFVLDGRSLGKLALLASNERRAWLIDRLSLAMPEGSFDAKGAWGRPVGVVRGPRETRLDFTIDAPDAGKLLDRLGHAGTLRRGAANMSGNVSWQGSPLSIDHATLSGAFHLKATNGQFSKINPGAGRLLGILSLQSLPRRITLDFRDVFSEGFAFDLIDGNVSVGRGIMKTEDFELAGPAARIRISGSADIAAETQNLVVRVQPALSDSLSVGAMIANPAVGVAAYLAQKVLQDPLGQIFAFRYAVTGSWDDPVVAKLAGAQQEKPPARN